MNDHNPNVVSDDFVLCNEKDLLVKVDISHIKIEDFFCLKNSKEGGI